MHIDAVQFLLEPTLLVNERDQRRYEQIIKWLRAEGTAELKSALRSFLNAEIGSEGGSAGTGAAKYRGPVHTQRATLLATIQRIPKALKRRDAKIATFQRYFSEDHNPKWKRKIERLKGEQEESRKALKIAKEALANLMETGQIVVRYREKSKSLHQEPPPNGQHD